MDPLAGEWSEEIPSQLSEQSHEPSVDEVDADQPSALHDADKKDVVEGGSLLSTSNLFGKFGFGLVIFGLLCLIFFSTLYTLTQKNIITWSSSSGTTFGGWGNIVGMVGGGALLLGGFALMFEAGHVEEAKQKSD